MALRNRNRNRNLKISKALLKALLSAPGHQLIHERYIKSEGLSNIVRGRLRSGYHNHNHTHRGMDDPDHVRNDYFLHQYSFLLHYAYNKNQSKFYLTKTYFNH